MNYTQNYHLPQWALNDRIMMDDFNNAMAGIENGISAAATTANIANQAASAAFTPSNKPFATGSYTGTGTQMAINLGFRPSFLIVTGSEQVFASSPGYLMLYTLITGGTILPACVTFTDTGFTLNDLEDTMAPKLLERKRYDYIAFR